MNDKDMTFLHLYLKFLIFNLNNTPTDFAEKKKLKKTFIVMLARVQPEVANTNLGSSKDLEYNPQANTCNIQTKEILISIFMFYLLSDKKGKKQVEDKQ